MSGSYAYTPTIWPSVLTVLLLIALAVYAWQRRGVPGALVFAMGCLLFAPWAAGSVMELAAVDVECKIFWFQFQRVWQVPAATASTCFVLEYAWPGRWLTRRNLVLLSLPSLLALAMILTNDLHHLAWRGFGYDGTVIPLRGPVNWTFLAYAYGLGILNLIVFAWLLVRSPQHRWPVAIMSIGQVVGRAVFLLETTPALQPALPIDAPPIAFEYLMYAIALFGFRILDPIPLARQVVIEQLQSGMLVLDSQGRVASLNPAAERILGAPASRARSRPVRELLPAYPDGPLDDPGGTEIELSLPEGHLLERTPGTIRDGTGAEQAVRHYTLEISLLKDWRGLVVGRLLLLRDVTAQKRAQAQFVEQQRTRATVQERERLARELHDSLGQTLAAAHLQASSARLLLAQGETAQTDECLERLADMTLDAESDVREYLLAAKTAFAAGQPFFRGLRQYAARFTQQYSLPVELSVPPQLEAAGLGPAVEMQLLRIVQEALSNVRKHARARNAQVIFTVSGPLAQITIRDDGQGFDPSAVATLQGQGFGLQAMRERAEGLGGYLEVISQPGQGTQVVARVPLGGER
jgi:PAS domain S-box-containing protein